MNGFLDEVTEAGFATVRPEQQSTRLASDELDDAAGELRLTPTINAAVPPANTLADEGCVTMAGGAVSGTTLNASIATLANMEPRLVNAIRDVVLLA